MKAYSCQKSEFYAYSLLFCKDTEYYCNPRLQTTLTWSRELNSYFFSGLIRKS